MRTATLLNAKVIGTTFLGGGGFKRLRERDQLWVVPLALLGVLVGTGSVVWLFYQNFVGMALLGDAVGNRELPLYIAVIVTWVLVFVAGFPIAMSVLYFSSDTRMLIALPIRPYQIITANLALVYAYSLPVAIAVFVPAVVAYGRVAGVGPWQIVAALIVTLGLPLLPIALSVALVMLLTRAVNVSRHKTALEAIGMVLMLLLIVGLQLAFSRSMISSSEGEMLQSGLAGFVVKIEGAVPPAMWGAKGLAAGGAFTLLAFVAISVASLLAVGTVAQAEYLGHIVSQPEARGRSRAGSGEIAPRRPALWALIVREIRTLTSNSTFLFESAGELAVFPIVLVVFRITLPGSLVDSLVPFVDQFAYLAPALLAALSMMAAINTVSSTAISREGRTFDLSLSLPLSGAAQVRAKIATYLLFFGPAFVVNSAIGVSILRLPWWYAPALSLAGAPVLVAIALVTIQADIRRPHLTWTHPQQAVKQNLNALLGMGLALITLLVVAAPAVAAAALGGGPWVMISLAFAGACLVSALLWGAVGRYADARYAAALGR